MELARYLEVCRLCLKQSSTNLNIFSDKNVEDKIAKVLRFSIPNNAQLSSLVCLACYECVFRFFDYSELVQRNQAYLDGLLVQIPEKVQPKPLIIIPVSDVTSSEGAYHIEVNIQKEQLETIVVEPAQEDEENAADVEPEKPKTLRKTKGDALIKEFVSLSCEVCTEPAVTFDNFKLLQEHYIQNHKQPGYAVCCGKKFARKDRLITHITNHINPDAFKCAICEHASKSKSLLRIHMKRHLGDEERRFACRKCDQRFILRSQLVNHEASHLSDSEKKHVCDVCGKAFALKFVLKNHKLLHTSSGKEFVCEICAKPLSSRSSLKAHMETHDAGQSQPSKVQCDVCSQWYKNAETLRTHVRVRHRDQRVHRCDHCGKVFPTLSSLTGHVKYVHLREMNFSCEQCQKSFRKKVEYKEHMARSHGDKWLYQCEFCDKKYACSSNYFSHRKSKHPKEYARKKIDKQQETI
ncbi:zinc finger protein 555 [Culex quinquefasciatus]|uniref:Zinc finger protein 555 n=1 Tax=Culex quinquefasciatus TaxID=7176 RepID=B0X3F8_CULQU|nr:zinc finger protein 555 [Culex quinquefasciatus]|eukprot:XP_001864180.1 zinc finger protein 555 [Culex quinquefasciatus]